VWGGWVGGCVRGGEVGGVKGVKGGGWGGWGGGGRGGGGGGVGGGWGNIGAWDLGIFQGLGSMFMSISF